MTYRRIADGSPDRAVGRIAEDAAELVDLEHRALPAALTPRRSHRFGASLAIGAGVAVIVAGLIFSARPDLAVVVASPDASPGLAAVAPSDAASAAPSPRPSDRPGESARPRNTPPPCVPLTPDDPVETALRFASGTWLPWVRSDGFVEPPAPADWIDAVHGIAQGDADRTMRVGELARVEITTSQRRCLGSWEITFVRLDGLESLQTLTAQGRVEPARGSAEFVAAPRGDWLVRLVLRFPLVRGSRWIEAHSRLVVGDAPATSDPLVSPAVACGPDSVPAEAYLFVDGNPAEGSAVGPAPTPTSTTVVAAALGAVVELRLAGDRCAVAWRIDRTRRPLPGEAPDDLIQTIEYATIAPDPTIAAQNRFGIELGPVGGTWDVVASLLFVDGTEIRRAWAIAAEPLDVPPLIIGVAGGSTTVAAWNVPCVTVTLRSGQSFGDSCGPSEPVRPLETLVLPSASRLTAQAIGWSLDGAWSAQYGMFAREGGEWLGFQYTESLRSASSPPVDFPVPPSTGIWTLELATCVTRDGNQVCGSWYVNVEVR